MSINLKGSQQLRTRLVCSTLSGRSLKIEDIRSNQSNPGLQDYEASLLRLIEKISNGCVIQINHTGTRLRYKPGIIQGGRDLTHDCGTSRAIGYFLEPLIVLALFGKKPLSITLNGITNDDQDPSVDSFRIATLPLLRKFGIPIEELQLKISKRGFPPLGGGEISLKIPIVPSLSSIQWTEEGMIKRIRGIAYSARISPHISNRMVDATRGMFNSFLPDVYVFTDHYSGLNSGKSPGYGICLVAESTTGCLLSAETVTRHYNKNENNEKDDGKSNTGEILLPEDIGRTASQFLLHEVKQGGVVDSSHQGLLFLLCALCPDDVCKVRVGPLTPHSIRTLREIKSILGVQFQIKTDSSTQTVLLSCVGSGLRNLSRKVS